MRGNSSAMFNRQEAYVHKEVNRNLRRRRSKDREEQTPLLDPEDNKATGMGEKERLLPGVRGPARDRPRYVPTDWDDSLPYGGKVFLARRKKPDGIICIALQVFAVAGAVGMVYYAWYHTDHMHLHVTKAYAHFGHKDAQATMGHRHLNGIGVEKNHTEAMRWFRQAADQGHPHASYNVAVGHLQGLNTGLQRGDAYRLIQHAADNGVKEAVEVMEKMCSRGHCDA